MADKVSPKDTEKEKQRLIGLCPSVLSPTTTVGNFET
jgi:hypothetical protein